MAESKPKSERNKPLQLDDAAFDALTALIAVRDGLASEAQVEDALNEKKKRLIQDTAAGTDAPKPKRLAWMLVDDGVLDDAKAKDLEKRLDPEVLPGYRILGEAGRGGMGTVFKARQLSMDRIVALKILANRLSKDERYVEKFLQEARAAGKLNHENIVSAIDCGAASGFHFFVMEFVDGKTAMDVLAKEGPLPWEKAFEYAEQVGRALEHAHAAGLVHRDVKPENVMVSQTVTGMRVKLCDLGLAKEAVPAGTGEKSKMTEGTPSYASPEQALGRTDIDARSDVYSLGATLYHLLSGEAPFDGENARTILWKQVHKPFPSLDEKLPNVPAPLRALIAKMVEKDRDKRLPSARAFLDELVAARKALAAPTTGETPSVPTPKGRPVAIIAALLAVSVPIGLVAVKSAEKPPVVVPVATVTAKPPDDPGDTRPKIVRLGEEDALDSSSATLLPPKTPEHATSATNPGDDAARGAQLLLDRANQFRDANPDDAQGFAARLRAVIERYPGTPAAVVAGSDLAALENQGQAAVEKDLEKAKQDAQDKADKGKYTEAVSILDALSEKWDARVLARLKPSIERARQIILDQARVKIAALVKEGDQHLLKNEPIDDTVDKLLALEQDSPPPVSKEARAKADDLKARLAAAQADSALKEAAQRRDEALAQGKLDEGERIVQEAGKDAKLLAKKKELDAFVAETADISRIWHGFDDRMKSFVSQAKHVYKRRGAPPLEGQLKEYDSVSWSGRVKPFGLKELVSLDVRDFPAEDLVDIALPTHEVPDLRAATLYFIARRDTDAAALAVDKAVAAGMPDDPALRVRIASLQGQDREARAARLVSKALAPGAVNNAPDEVIGAVKALATSFSDTQPYADKLDDLKKVYVAARVARLTGADIAQLFSGKVVRGRDTVKLEYDFSKDARAARDWNPDPALTKDSAIRWEKGREAMKGVVRNVAVWEAGAITVDARVITLSALRPNVNFVLSENPGWEGLLVGFGFKTGNIDKIRVLPGMPKKPGWNITTPCNVVYELNGQAPQAQGNCLVAEEEPQAATGRAIHYSIKRDAKAFLAGYMGSSNPIALKDAPRTDEAGHVAVAGLETEILIEHLEIVGKLEQQWLADRARSFADAEAALFPVPPPPPKAPAPKGNGG